MTACSLPSVVPYDNISTPYVRPIYDKCCFCVPIRIGCFILGYLNLAFNTFHTLALLTLTAYIGISTHGFNHFDNDEPREFSNQVPNIESVEKPFLNQIGVLLMVVLCANFAWLVINVACLVGLHKKRPGPIRIYVGFATGRLLLSMAGFIYLVMSSNATAHTIISHSADIGRPSSSSLSASYAPSLYSVFTIILQSYMSSNATVHIISYSADIGLAAYFILVYWVYAAQLERELQREEAKASTNLPEVLSGDIAFIFPVKGDKENLVYA